MADDGDTFERVAILINHMDDLDRWSFAFLQFCDPEDLVRTFRDIGSLQANGAKVSLEPVPVLLTSLLIDDHRSVHEFSPPFNVG